MTIIEQVRRQKRKLERAEAASHKKLTGERAELRRLMEVALTYRYRKADLARALGVSQTRVGDLLRGRGK